MKITQDLITVNFTKRPNREIKYIVVHYFGGLGTDEGVVNFFDRDATNASAHYALDDDSITQAVLDENVAWHCGDSGIGSLKGKCTNANSIGIEVRPYKVNASHISAADTDWYFHGQTVANLTELVKSLMAAHGIDAAHVIRHYDVTSKLCPRPWVGEDINTYYGKTGNQLWAEFKAGLEDEEVVKTYGAIAEMPGWAKATMQKLWDKKYITSFGFSEEALRIFVINDRAGLYK